MDTIQKFKQRKIVKAQLGTLLKKGWDWFKNSNQIAAIAESPAVMTASGWRVDKNGQTKQDQQNNKEVKQLRNNLTTIGEATVTAPTMVGDVGALVTAVRHPVQTGKTIWKAGQDALWFLRNPRAVKVYHGTQSKKFTNLRDAKTASDVNIGLHVSPNKSVSEGFSGADGHIMEAYIPRHNMETIDLGYNDYNLLSNNYSSFQYQYPKERFTSQFEKDLFGKYGFRNIPLRDATWPKMTSKQIQQAENIVQKGKQAKNSREARQINEEAAKFFSDNGKKVIKYDNKIEGGGTSYIVTDPSVFYNPQNYNWQQIINRTKYPIMYETNK